MRRVLRDELDPADLPPLLWDLWADGFRTGANRAGMRTAQARADADYWAYIALNPAEDRERHAQMVRATLAAMDAAKGEVAYQRDRQVLDDLERTDPLEYRRLAWLYMTDRAEFRDAVDALAKREVTHAR